MIAANAELIALLSIPAFLLLDLVVRHRKFRAPRFWRLQGLAVTVVTLAVSVAVTGFWARVFAGRSLLHLDGLGIWAGAVVGVLTYELVHYWYHRLAHRSNVLWRLGHQMHHAPESLDAWGANYLHPVDTFFFSTWVSLTFIPLLGLSADAAAVGVAFTTVNAMIQHANIRTPRWLGWFIQRPESHSVHHGRHRSNYADLPLWDMVFGTFENPAAMEEKVGFYDGASRRVLDALLFRDVSRPRDGGDPASAPRRERPRLERVA